MDMSSSAPLGQQRARSPVAGRVAALTVVVAASAAAWSWLGHRDAPEPPVSVGSDPIRPLASTPVPPAAVTTAAPKAVPPVDSHPPARAARPLDAAADITALARTPAQSPVAGPAPSFDIVRVDPHGAAVIAGRSAPGAEVVVAANGHPIAKTQADAQGQWVALPAAPLPAGGQQLTVSSLPAQPGGAARIGSAPVIVLVPGVAAVHAPKPAEQGAVAVLAPPTGPTRLLQPPAAPGKTASGPPRLGLGMVDYDSQGAIRFAGTAAPHSTVRMYVDRRAVGDAVADAQGRWTLVPAAPIAEGRHQLRTDQLRPNGTVAARIALPFQRVAVPDTALLDGKVVIQPGENLWRIARQVYGRGIRYTVIYLANRSQIRNPDLIYPGQVFTVPAASAEGTVNPAPASFSKSK